MKLHVMFIAAIAMSTASAAVGVPLWATKDTQSLTNKLYKVVCHGTGPSLNEAREQALNQCNLFASKQLGGSIKVRTMTIETETQAALHQEISNEVTVKNLICKPLNEEAEYGASSTSVFIKCQYDLSQVESQQGEPSKIKSKAADAATVSISIVPMCSTIIIRGATPRIVKCQTNPIHLTVNGSDTEVVIRADGYSSKTIPVGELIGGQTTNVFLKSN